MPNLPTCSDRFAQRLPANAAGLEIIRRRPTVQQGRALEVLGHAIEYLVDSELRSDGDASVDVDRAVRILMALSRELFAECRDIVPIRRRLRNCLVNMFGRPALVARDGTSFRQL